jgi:hypothetical protein
VLINKIFVLLQIYTLEILSAPNWNQTLITDTALPCSEGNEYSKTIALCEEEKMKISTAQYLRNSVTLKKLYNNINNTNTGPLSLHQLRNMTIVDVTSSIRKKFKPHVDWNTH